MSEQKFTMINSEYIFKMQDSNVNTLLFSFFLFFTVKLLRLLDLFIEPESKSAAIILRHSAARLSFYAIVTSQLPVASVFCDGMEILPLDGWKKEHSDYLGGWAQS